MKAMNDGSEVYAALEKKAELYDRLVRGELPDEEEKEKYSVDFLRKGTLDDEFKEMEGEKHGETPYNGRDSSDTLADEGSAEKLKTGVGWGLRNSTGLTQEQKQAIK